MTHKSKPLLAPEQTETEKASSQDITMSNPDSDDSLSPLSITMTIANRHCAGWELVTKYDIFKWTSFG